MLLFQSAAPGIALKSSYLPISEKVLEKLYSWSCDIWVFISATCELYVLELGFYVSETQTLYVQNESTNSQSYCDHLNNNNFTNNSNNKVSESTVPNPS